MVEANHSPTAAGACRQMSVPLTYDDGVNLRRRNCENDKAYFMCEAKRK